MYYAFSEVFKLCETENLNFAVYFTIDKHSYEQVHLKVEPKSFLYEFLNSGDPLYSARGYIEMKINSRNLVSFGSANFDVSKVYQRNVQS